MDAPYLLAVLYIYIPIIWGMLSNHAQRNGYTNISTVKYAFKLTKILERDERTIYLLSVLFTFFMPISIYGKLTENRNDFIISTAVALLLTATVLAAVSFFTSPTVRTAYKKYTLLLNSSLVILVAVNYSIATSYAESTIINLTGVRAGELPTALSWLSIIMVPLAWLITLATFFLAIYAVALFGAGIKSGRRTPLSSPLNQVYIKSRATAEHTKLYTISFCGAILALNPIILVGILLKTDWAETKIREQLVSASFHVKPPACGLDKVEGAAIALLEEDKAIIAIPDQKFGYKFGLIQCTREWMTPEQFVKAYDVEKSKK